MAERITLPRFASCVVCGDPAINPKSLGMPSVREPDGRVTAQFTPSTDQAGFPGTIHGGMLASLLDEVSVWAASLAADAFCVTRELRTQFRRPAEPGRPLQLQARVTDVARIIVVEAEARDSEGTPITRSTGRFVPAPAFDEEWERRVRPCLASGGS